MKFSLKYMNSCKCYVVVLRYYYNDINAYSFLNVNVESHIEIRQL